MHTTCFVLICEKFFFHIYAPLSVGLPHKLPIKFNNVCVCLGKKMFKRFGKALGRYARKIQKTSMSVLQMTKELET